MTISAPPFDTDRYTRAMTTPITTAGQPTHASQRSAPVKHTVTLIPGDGIGPEVVAAACRVAEAAGANVEWERCDAGASVFKRGIASGVPADTMASIRRNRVALKGPLETPVGYGEKSANVTLRKLFELYGNLRPVRELPGVVTPFSGRGIDLVVVRENIEDVYAGVEHMQTPGVAHCVKLATHKGCEKIIRLAFEVARAEGRTKVTCATKANIMKITEGMLKQAFERVAPEYPDITPEHILIDNCAHMLVRYPEQFQVIVTANMNGDILSDLTSGLVGGLGFAASANIGNDVMMFEAVHGSAPAIAGKNIANPTAMILSTVLMLRHIGEQRAADTVENAILFTLESGQAATADVHGEKSKVGTAEFADIVIANLGKRPERAPAARDVRPMRLPHLDPSPVSVTPATRRVIGTDVFIEWGGSAADLGHSLERLAEGTPLRLKMCSNRGVVVFPATEGGAPDRVDLTRCRFVLRDAAPTADLTDAALLPFLTKLAAAHRWTHVEKLHEFDGVPGYTKAQGEE